jgi:AraC-like DNA-binding protein
MSIFIEEREVTEMSGPKTYFEKQIEKINREYGLPGYYYVQARQSKVFMEKYLSEKIELQKIAAAAFMSRFHYIRIFKQVYGVSPRQYLRDLRISRAKELLKQGLPPAQVCTEVGYDSLPTFSSAFKRGTGYSPKAYQNLHKSNPE